MKIQKKALKISLLLTLVVIAIIVPVVTVSAKKVEWTSGPVYINDSIEQFSWDAWSAKPWLKGSGTEEDPYLIKDLTIEVSGTLFAMMIENSNVHFKIMGCSISNGGFEEDQSAGIILAGVQNGIVFKNIHTLKDDQTEKSLNIRIYNVTGDLVYSSSKAGDRIRFGTGSGASAPEWKWDVKNNRDRPVASGLYMFVFSDDKDKSVLKKGKLIVVR